MSVTQLIDPRTELGMDQLCINTIRTLSIDALQTGQIRTCGYPDGAGTFGLHGLEPCDAVRSARSNLAQSRSIRALERLRLDAALVRPPLDEDASGEREYERLGQPSVTLDDIRRFRQLDSKAPGHPEYHWVSGVETTTGPLGQGVATSVGVAIAQKWLANRYNRPGFQIFDYTIYEVCGDGCLTEGVSSEAASLAAHLGLDNLCWIYDNNHITIEGNTRITFTEDVAARFPAYGWNILRVEDANDLDRIEHALGVFRKTEGRPTLIVLDSHIGYGSPNKKDTAAAHSEPSGEAGVNQ